MLTVLIFSTRGPLSLTTTKINQLQNYKKNLVYIAPMLTVLLWSTRDPLSLTTTTKIKNDKHTWELAALAAHLRVVPLRQARHEAVDIRLPSHINDLLHARLPAVVPVLDVVRDAAVEEDGLLGLRFAVFATFLFASKRIEANMDLIRFIFACFGIFANTIYSHHSLHICFKIFAQIRIQIFNLLENKYISSYWRIFASETLSQFHFKHIFAYKQLFACKYSHTSKYSLANIRIIAYFRFVLLQIIKESLSQS